MLTEWIQDGTAAVLLDAIRAEARARQTLAANTLATLSAPPKWGDEGIHIWYPLPSAWQGKALAAAALAGGGLSLMPSDRFYAGPLERLAESPVQAIRISLGGGHDRATLGRALSYLAGLLRQPPGTAPFPR